MQINRRKNLKLRALFDEAYARIEPVFKRQPPQGLPIEWVVFRTARANYPQLNTLDLYQFAVASSRVYRSRHPGAEGHLAF
ncbi:MAG: hypothetical protein KF853_07685 [Rhodocyclaceae bacterium]|jgi:hypothetical protein|nr:hypothetical protein [Rhodocyclaceae bacterium]PKO66716.1 MAG: hypothetical protein CVU20_15145 [Betaproteobacteria bacterium HGW-Betaproteobacteria-14]MBX3676887.1 hypothetical protein [Rhodocyclaceae bacterium]MBZ0133408.1 hypothetical protein [Rhodocyclaceae bacterium]MCO5095899.1 hypothetical protein [Rhodocyclaceae bacterium]